jgi:hypothetical protein
MQQNIEKSLSPTGNQILAIQSLAYYEVTGNKYLNMFMLLHCVTPNSIAHN